MKNLLAASLCFASACLAVVPPALAQTPAPPDQPAFRSGIELVTIDVGVIDSKGVPVDDLRAPDFTVKVDGVERRVVSANLVRVDVEAARRKVENKSETFYTTNLTPPDGRQIVIAVDQVNVRPGSLRTLLNSAATFLDRLSPLDQVAFIAYPDPGPRVSLTRDLLKIKLAMQQIVGLLPATIGNGASINIGVTEALDIDERHDQVTLDVVVRRECSGIRDPDRVDLCRRDVEQIAAQVAQHARETAYEGFSGLTRLLRELAVIDGPKQVILLSEGLAIKDSADLDTIAMLAGRARAGLNVLIVDENRLDIGIVEAPPTEAEDRRRQTTGLQSIAAASRGSVFHAIGTAAGVFDRLLSEMSAFYVLGVEQMAGDDEDRMRRVDVAVRRRGVTIRSPQAFALSAARRKKGAIDEELRNVLLSPFPVAELPLRVTTFAQQDEPDGKVRLIVSAEVGQPGTPPGSYAVAYLLANAENRVVASFSRHVDLKSPSDGATEPLDFSSFVLVDPGIYSLRFGVVDAEGRRGSINREVSAWKMSGEELATGDLMVGNLPQPGEGLRPALEPHVTGDTLVTLMDVYSTSAAKADATRIVFEIGDSADSAALITLPTELRPGRQDAWRVAQGVMTTRALPPGRYVARARVLRDAATVMVLSRPFVLERPGAVAERAAVPFGAAVPPFDRAAALRPDLLKELLDDVERRTPALKSAVAEARAARYGAAALEALGSGDQAAAQFLRGVDLFTRGQFDQAATQLNLAAGPRREFFPAAFLLGAIYAAAGRDRDAAGVWQMSLGGTPRPSVVYGYAADARMRDRAPESAVEILEPAYRRTPADDELGRRLAIAYVMSGKYLDALPVLDGVLSRHPTDADLLFAAVFAQYETVRAGQALSSVDRDKIKRYAAAYKGDQRALLDKYLEVLAR